MSVKQLKGILTNLYFGNYRESNNEVYICERKFNACVFHKLYILTYFYIPHL